MSVLVNKVPYRPQTRLCSPICLQPQEPIEESALGTSRRTSLRSVLPLMPCFADSSVVSLSGKKNHAAMPGNSVGNGTVSYTVLKTRVHFGNWRGDGWCELKIRKGRGVFSLNKYLTFMIDRVCGIYLLCHTLDWSQIKFSTVRKRRRRQQERKKGEIEEQIGLCTIKGWFVDTSYYLKLKFGINQRQPQRLNARAISAFALSGMAVGGCSWT